VKQALLLAFAEWGCPKILRYDNGSPIGVPTRDSVSPLSLVIASYGIKPCANAPYSPTSNGTVERAQGTTSRWAEVKCAENLDKLNARLQEVIVEQREKYKPRRLKGQTRLELHPTLRSNQRIFEEQNIDWQKSRLFLQEHHFVRKVDKAGGISIQQKRFQIDRKLATQKVSLEFNPNDCNWIIKNNKMEVIKTVFDERFTDKGLIDFTTISKN
jgi:transposase InsO family protein